MSTVNRRSFLKVAAGVAAGSVAGLSHAMGSEGVKWDETHEVIVIGAGGAGMAAAVKAAQTGAKDVVVYEKMPFTGGNTLVSQGFINAADPVRQPRQGIKDSPENHMKQTLAAGDFRGDPERVRVLCENAYGAITWLESLGMKFKDNVIQIFGALYPRSHIPALPKGQGYGTVLTKAANDLGVKVVTGWGLVEIVREKPFEGDVLGVVVENAKKERRMIRAKRGVVLAAGGFSANAYLRELHDPRVKGLGTDNLPGATGEAIEMAQDIGAQVTQMEQIQTHPTVVPKVGEMITEAVRGNGAILINKDGKRFFNELDTRDAVSAAILKQKDGKRFFNELDTRDAVSAAILKQKDGIAYLFFDSDMQKSLKATNGYIKQPYCLTGATLDEIAQKMGVDAATLKSTMDAWKAGKAAGKDQFERADMPRNLDKGPFYAIAVTPAVHHTMGGLKIDSKTQVYNVKGQVIPGLFAAGEITGGVHGGNRLGGNAQADIVTFGRIAGQQAFIFAKQVDAAAKK